jgi:hypothetical protein
MTWIYFYLLFFENGAYDFWNFWRVGVFSAFLPFRRLNGAL